MTPGIVQRFKDRYLLWKYTYPFNRRNKYRTITEENTICLFSFPRSGSTWLSEILINIPNTCLFDEPFLRDRIKGIEHLPNNTIRKFNEIKDLGFYFFQPIPYGADWFEAKKVIAKLFQGRIVSLGLYDDYGLWRLKKATTFIVKMNYASLMASWMQSNFHCSALVLLRNPLAVLASSIRHEWISKIKVNKNAYFPHFKFNEVFQKYYMTYRRFVKSKEDLLIFLWAINMKEGILQMSPEKSHFVFYEHLLINFESELNRIFEYLKCPFPTGVLEKRFIPSKSSKPYAFESIRSENQLNQWKRTLNKDQIKSAIKILEELGVDFYTNDLPDLKVFNKSFGLGSAS
ncbi:MAG: sulfotransferase domain-containing protein [Cytophagales bacterium]|nr:sulfotransferase domain-containing protein [Cytophagales bacterium]